MTTPIPPDPSPQDDEALALAIAGEDYKQPCPPIRGVVPFGKLFPFTVAERDQLLAVRDLIKQYVARPEPRRPLSLAIFGPPGSGKSFAVQQILDELNLELKLPDELKLISTTVNLTQASDASALSEVLAHAAIPAPSGSLFSGWFRKSNNIVNVAGSKVPVIFFDEFDAPRDGAPYGWLAWFLAPMQDGNFLHNGQIISLPRAVYFFAGGTAVTMQQFSDLDRLPDFQRAKGPDFISRLRGFLNVCGPNEKPRMLRRAVIFRAELSHAIGKGAASFRPDSNLMKSLLRAGRYRHGARSIAAVVDLSDIRKSSRFGWEDLPKDHLLEQHIDRGPLDAKLIGGSVAFSGYDANAKAVREVWCTVAQTLLNEGATLSYAGRWALGPGRWLMDFLRDELRERPPEPKAKPDRRDKPDPWLESFLDDVEQEKDAVEGAISAKERDRIGLKVTFAPHLTDEERGLEEWLRVALERFRRRLAVADASVARFVVSGTRKGHKGRFPGIPEEVMLTLAQEKPVYIAGAFGGAAADVGSLLGLAHPRAGGVPSSLQAEPSDAEERLSTIKEKLRPGPWMELPIKAADLVPFLKEHALGGPKWPYNGLTFEENRRLFASNEPKKVADLIGRGLLRLFAKADPVRTEP